MRKREAGDKASIGFSIIAALGLLYIAWPSIDHHQVVKQKPAKAVTKTPVIQSVTLEVINLPPPPALKQSTALVKISPAAKQIGDRKERVTLPPQKTNPSVLVETKTSKMVEEGRVLLKLLEAGKGPNVEIAWPTGHQSREDLYLAFYTCLDLQTGIMNNKEDIFLQSGKSGQAAEINPDQSSLFLRQSAGHLSTLEQKHQTDIRNKHRLQTGQPVRLFSRVVDAALLGALFRLLPLEVSRSAQIQARYSLKNNAVIVERIFASGVPVSGQVHVGLGLLGRCG